MNVPFSRHWLLLLVLLTGCGSSEPVPTLEDSPYYPLQIGNRWVYEASKQQRVTEVMRHVLVSGQAAAVIETRLDDKLVAREYLHPAGDGLFILGIGDKELTKPLPFLRLPPTNGRTWKVNFKERGETHIYQIGRDNVTVPYGRYDDAITLHTEIRSGGQRKLSNVYWFVKDVGIVKHVVQAGDTTTVFELTEFARGK